MILGVEGIVSAHQLEPGRFYLEPTYNSEARLFQCIQTSEVVDGNPLRKALYFLPQEEQKLPLENVPDYGPLVALPPVQIRVDPPSISGSASMLNYTAGMFLVVGNEGHVTAQLGFRHWALINISTGRTVEGQIPREWVAFSRWLLVVEENGEEIPIASFGE